MTDPQQPVAPAPPPHPYAAPETRGADGPRGRGLSIAAMAIGLTALVTAVVAAFYFSIATVVAALLAICAIVLGIVALVKRQPAAPGIVGIAAGVVSVIVVIAVGAFSLAALILPDGPAANSGTGHGGDSSAEAPGAGASVAWPANMASGGIVFTGSGGEIDVIRTEPLEDNATPMPADPTAEGTDHVRVYLDYRCPFCASFEEANAETLEQVAQNGGAVELQPLTFLDRVSEGGYYSSRAAGAMACMADAQPEGAWAAHRTVMDTDFQPEEGGPGHDNRALIDAIDAASAGELGDEARSCIEEERFVPFAQALNDWVFANPVPHAEDPELRVTGTPLAVVNGVPYTGDPADGAAFRSFLEEQGVDLG